MAHVNNWRSSKVKACKGLLLQECSVGDFKPKSQPPPMFQLLRLFPKGIWQHQAEADHMAQEAVKLRAKDESNKANIDAKKKGQATTSTIFAYGSLMWDQAPQYVIDRSPAKLHSHRRALGLRRHRAVVRTARDSGDIPISCAAPGALLTSGLSPCP